MVTTELSRSKSICILAVVVCCFAILWPKIFLPMFQSALSMTSSEENTSSESCGCNQLINSYEICGIKIDDQNMLSLLRNIILDNNRNKICERDIYDLCGIDLYEGIDSKKDLISIHPLIEMKIESLVNCFEKAFGGQKIERHGMLPPKVKEAMKLSRPHELRREPGRPLLKDRVIPNKDQTKSGGIMGFVMPLYTVGIVVFFLYTMFKLVFKNSSEKDDILTDETPKVPDFKMDSEYRKFILSDEYDRNGTRIKSKTEKRKQFFKTNNEMKSEKVVKHYGKDNVTKALQTLIRDMEEFKAKLVEVEECRSKIAEIESAKAAAQLCLKKEKLNESTDQSNESMDGITNDEEENLIENESSDDCNQNVQENDFDNDAEQEHIENKANEQNENTECDYYYENMEKEKIRDKLVDALDPKLWESLKQEMRQLEKLKEE